jgi:hypothetical protein
VGVGLYTVGLGGVMAELFVTCPECGLREELAHGHQEFDDPRGKCSHRLNPAKCPALRVPLIAARRMLDFLEWDAILASDEAIPSSPSFVEASIVPEMLEPIRPSTHRAMGASRRQRRPVPDMPGSRRAC